MTFAFSQPKESDSEKFKKDISIHRILGYYSLVLVVFSDFCFFFNLIVSCVSSDCVQYVASVTASPHVYQASELLNDLFFFLTIVSGLNHTLIFLWQIENADEAAKAAIVRSIVICVILLYVLSTIILFYHHSLVLHKNIITYQMYKNHFDDIAETLERRQEVKKTRSNMAALDNLSRYESRSSKSRNNSDF